MQCGPVRGNHDRVLSVACALNARAYFRSASDVTFEDVAERVYSRYEDHLLLFTHGELSKRKMRQLSDTITAEARGLLGQTRYTTVHTGHLHHRAKAVEDTSGRVSHQAPSPSPDDRYHSKEAYTGSRRSIQMQLMRPTSCDEESFVVGL